MLAVAVMLTMLAPALIALIGRVLHGIFERRLDTEGLRERGEKSTAPAGDRPT